MSRYVFDNLSCDQAEDLLRQHGEQGTYLVSHFHDPESFGLSIRIRYNSVFSPAYILKAYWEGIFWVGLLSTSLVCWGEHIQT